MPTMVLFYQSKIDRQALEHAATVKTRPYLRLTVTKIVEENKEFGVKIYKKNPTPSLKSLQMGYLGTKNFG